MFQLWYLFIAGSSCGVDKEQHLWKWILKAFDWIYHLQQTPCSYGFSEWLQIDAPLLPLVFWFSLPLSRSHWDVLPVIKGLHFSQCLGITRKALMCSCWSSWLFCHPDAGRMSSSFLVDRISSGLSHPCIFPDQKNIRSHPDHHPGHGDHWRLRRVRVFPPQPIHWVRQVNCVRNVPQQTQHCQEKSQPAGDWTVLLHGERRFKNKSFATLYNQKWYETNLLFLNKHNFASLTARFLSVFTSI